jgi:hypothetical protein
MVGTPGENVDPEDFTDPIFNTVELDPVDSSATICVKYPNSWTQYVDNVNIAGSAGSRYWLDCPDQGDIVLGPRAGAALLGHVRIRTGATVATAANMFINSTSYEIFRSTSSLKYKQDIEPFAFDGDALLALGLKSFHDRGEVKAHDEWTARLAEHGPNEDDPEPIVRRYVGLIAEEVHEAGLSMLVQYDDATGLPDGLQYDRFGIAALQLIREQRAQIADLTSRIEQLEARSN